MTSMKRIISVVLAITVLLSCIIINGMSAAAETNYWDGKTITVPEGKGTASEPYLISNGAELAWMIRNNGNYYKFTEDIYLNDVDKVNWATGEGLDGYTPNSWYSEFGSSNNFSGTIDGDGHVIYGLYLKDTTAAGDRSVGYGLIPVGSNVTIKNLGVDKSYMEAYTNYSFGVFVGRGQGSLRGTIDSCYTGADVTLKGFDVGTIVGGGDIAGMLTIKNTYSLANATGSHLAGMVGDIWTLEYTFENCYAVGTRLTGKCGSAMLNYIKNSYCSVSYDNNPYLLESNMKGDIFTGNKMALSDAYEATESYPVLRVFLDNPSTGWNRLVEDYTKGSGTADDPFEISTVGQLAYAVASGGKYYKLVNNIYINDLDKIDWATGEVLDENYTPIEWFRGTDADSATYSGFTSGMLWSGTLDGNGYTINGLYYSPDFKDITAGLIPGVSSGTVKNLQLSNSYVVGGRFIGSISSTFAGTLSAVVVDNTVTVVNKKNIVKDSYSCGGLVGYTNGVTLRDCAFFGKLVGLSHIYGLVGTSWGTKIDAANCFSYGQQPFTTSIGSKEFNTTAEAETYYKNLYKVSGVYTDINKQGNKVSYKCDTDGDGTKDTVSYEVFTFTNLTSSQMVGKSALDNMPLLDRSVFYATAGLPRTKWWATMNGDADLDGMQAMAGDYAAIRKAIIGAGDTGCTDFDRNGKTDVFDLVKVWKLSPTYYSGSFTYTLENIGNPADYQIVYKNGDAEAKRAAEALAQVYKEQGVTLAVVADTVAVSAKEILVGDTNRGLHNDNLSDGQYEITVSGDKIQLSASASTTAALSTAVKTYKELSPKGFVAVTEGWHEYEGGSLTLKTNLTNRNFTDTRERTYTYVWGDEFYGDTLNPNKWVCTTGSSKMHGYSDLEIITTEEAVAVNGGSLNLTAGQRADGSFFAPASVHTQGTMEYRYGYIEMRAKIPYRVGVWPSFWMQSAATLGGRQNYDYMVEVDMLEVFGHTSDLYCNLHKWYSGAKIEEYGKDSIKAAANGSTSNWLEDFLDALLGKKKPNLGSEQRTLSNPEDWHTYGFAWDSQYMCMYVDRELFKVYEITDAQSVFGKDNGKMDPDMSGFNDPLYIIFNNHIFTENANYKPNTITGYESNLPATYEIDYVRLYQGTENDTQLWTKN